MRSLVQRVAFIFGVIFILVSLGGIVTPHGMGMDAHMETAPKELGIFPVNILHTLVHLAFGVWGFLASRTFPAARAYCRAGGVIYLVLAVLGFVAPDGFGLMPLGGADIGLHAVLGIGLAIAGFTARPPVALHA